MLLLRAHVLALGHSGVRAGVVERMVEMLNRDLIPVVPEQGSLGASGDLALLANLALPLVGRGELLVDGTPQPAGDVLRSAGLEPLQLKAKEGLALVNGTQGMLAIGILAVARADRLVRTADVTAAMSVEAALGSTGSSTSGSRRSARTRAWSPPRRTSVGCSRGARSSRRTATVRISCRMPIRSARRR